MRRVVLTALCGLAAVAASTASSAALAADDGGKTAARIDVAALVCRDYEAIAAGDAKAYGALGVWLDGWLSGKNGVTDYGPATLPERMEHWRRACADTPDAALLDVATAPETAAPAVPDGGGEGGFNMAFLKCYQFIDLAEQDRPAAVAAVRWNDGWHAAGVYETDFYAKDHEKMTDGFLEACANRKYHRKNLIRVMGGKYR